MNTNVKKLIHDLIGVYQQTIHTLESDAKYRGLYKLLRLAYWFSLALTLASFIVYGLGYSFLYGFYFGGKPGELPSSFEAFIHPVPFNFYSVLITGLLLLSIAVLFIYIFFVFKVRNVSIKHREAYRKKITDKMIEEILAEPVTAHSNSSIVAITEKYAENIRNDLLPNPSTPDIRNTQDEFILRFTSTFPENFTKIFIQHIVEALEHTVPEKVKESLQKSSPLQLFHSNQATTFDNVSRRVAEQESDQIAKHFTDALLQDISLELTERMSKKVETSVAPPSSPKEQLMKSINDTSSRIVVALTIFLCLHGLLSYHIGFPFLYSFEIWSAPAFLALLVYQMYLMTRNYAISIHAFVLSSVLSMMLSLVVSQPYEGPSSLTSLLCSATIASISFELRNRQRFLQALFVVSLGVILLLLILLVILLFIPFISFWPILSIFAVCMALATLVAVKFIPQKILTYYQEDNHRLKKVIADILAHQNILIVVSLLSLPTLTIFLSNQMIQLGDSIGQQSSPTDKLNCIRYSQTSQMTGRVVAEKEGTYYISDKNRSLALIKSQDTSATPFTETHEDKICPPK